MANADSTYSIEAELAKHGLEEAEMHANHAHQLICEAINDPDAHERYLEGAKALLRQSRAIMQRLIDEDLRGKSEVSHG
jgi:hypothetical protein